MNNEPRTYALPTDADEQKGAQRNTLMRAWESLRPLMVGEERRLIITLIAVLTNTLATLLAPVIIAHAVDTYIAHGDVKGVLMSTVLLFAIYTVVLIAGYNQTKNMGTVGRSVLFKLRNELFSKLQELPIAFFNQNKTGDLISRINNDTDKLNQFFAQALVQFIGNGSLILGAGIFLVVLNWKLGLAALVPAALVFIVTQLISAWVKRKSRAGLQSLGSLSAEIQESLDNLK